MLQASMASLKHVWMWHEGVQSSQSRGHIGLGITYASQVAVRFTSKNRELFVGIIRMPSGAKKRLGVLRHRALLCVVSLIFQMAQAHNIARAELKVAHLVFIVPPTH